MDDESGDGGIIRLWLEQIAYAVELFAFNKEL